MEYKTEQQLLSKAEEAVGKTFYQIDQNNRLSGAGKGNLGQVIEESHFGYEVNSNKEADFKELGIELKVTPIKQNKNGTISAKERLVLNIIDFFEEVNKDFFTSSFWIKNERLLLMFYLWQPDINRGDYKIIKSYLHDYPKEDLEIIMNDWNTIVNKIKAGRAHELSEADTNYLGACSKGKNKSSERKQPFSDKMAMQRAFSLKSSYMTTLVRQIFNKEELTRFTSPQELKNKTLEQSLLDKFSPYFGKTLSNIAEEQNITVNSSSKSFLPEFISSLLGIKGTSLNKIEEFQKANIDLKTIRLEPNGKPREHMSFKNIDFNEIANTEPEDLWIYDYFESTKLLFIIFEYKETKSENKNRELYFNGIKLWNMPKDTIESTILPFLYDLKKTVIEGIQLERIEQKNGFITKNNLPKPKSNGVCHIRPKAKNAQDTTLLPDGRSITKQAFWLDKEYIVKELQRNN